MLHNENGFLVENSLDITPPVLIGTLSEECIKCVALSFLAEHGRTNHNCCCYGKVELASVLYPETLKSLLLGSHSDAM